MIVRDATVADLPTILQIHNWAIANTTAIWDEEPVPLREREEWFAARQAAGLPVIVAEVGGAVAGYASYGPWRPKSGYRHTMENSLYVHPDHQGQGVGRTLLPALVEIAEAAPDVHCIVAGIESSNEVSLALHRRHGFVEVGRLPQVGLKFGAWLDLVHLQRLVD